MYDAGMVTERGYSDAVVAVVEGAGVNQRSHFQMAVLFPGE